MAQDETTEPGAGGALGTAAVDGTLTVTGDGRATVRFERHLPGASDEVWRALTEPARLASWFPTEVATEGWQVGATLDFTFRDGEGPALAGTVLACEPPRLLEYTWGDDLLRFELEAAGAGGTRLVFGNTVEAHLAARNAAGWQLCLDLLLGGTPDEDAWRGLFAGYVDAFVPVLGLQEGPPADLDEG